MALCRIMHDYIVNASTIRECNFAMGTIILGKGFAQAHELYARVLVVNPFPKLLSSC